ncbi:unnamed protein product [Clonostachys rhizophaga]|uniref:CHAT domain-containing protein n=1 Tax=Clonostachys rhizophaga TaxID=160324 RepID=A0A9N9VJ97_9HYPO|nr:unnamed protein product [Clonostachys rhizophaga]
MSFRMTYQSRHTCGLVSETSISTKQYSLVKEKKRKKKTAPTLLRVQCGVKISQGIATEERYCWNATVFSIDLIPQLSIRLLRQSEKQYIARVFSDLATRAVGFALTYHEEKRDKVPEGDDGLWSAIHLMERSRGIIATSLDDIRADVDILGDRLPGLVGDITRLRQELEQLELDDRLGANSNGLNLQFQRRYEIGLDLEMLYLKMKKEPEFDKDIFTSVSDMVEIAGDRGPIIIINVMVFRSDAIIITKKDRGCKPHHVPLLGLQHAEIISKLKTGNLGLPSVLEWLWDTVAAPVLSALGFNGPPSNNDWPHIWWIPTGPLTAFPLHAAGYHMSNTGETVMDRVMSSYSSSVKAITEGRRRSTKPVSRHKRALLVGMSNTPGYIRLPYAADEIEAVHGCCKSMGISTVELTQENETVLGSMKNCDIFHFAGHGYTDYNDPSQSYLALKDPMTVDALLKLNLYETQPFLAFLSACGTGRAKDSKLFDESIHLINSFKLAGFRNVIGTLWEVRDKACVDVARITYELLNRDGLTDDAVCRGLHEATRRMRDQWVQDISNQNLEWRMRSRRDMILLEEVCLGAMEWVPYVHFGM